MNNRIRNRLILSVGALMLGASSSLWAADYFVDQGHPQASDDNPGTESKPWLTLYRAAKAPLQPGDTVYVKAGTYDVSHGGIWNRPAINPASSGAPGQPITFKSLPTHAAILDTHNTAGNPAIGVSMRSHVVIDGFVIPNPGDKGIAVFGAQGAPAKDIVIQNNIIYGVYQDGGDNTDGIRLEHAHNVVVRNNKIYNVRNGGGSSNAAAVKTYHTRHVVIENNELYGVVAGVKEKEASSYLTVRYNRIYDCQYGFVLNNQNTGVTEQIRYHGNVVECSTGFETDTQASAVMKDIYVYNNTFADYSLKGVHLNQHGKGFYIYNNIFYRSSPSVGMADFFTRLPNTSQVKLMDYNMYLRDPKVIVGLYGLNDTLSTLSAWQARYGLEGHSRVGDPNFVDAAGGNYRLAAGSPAIKAGRDLGGKTVNIGAYATGGETIGIVTAAKATPPKPPKLITAN